MKFFNRYLIFVMIGVMANFNDAYDVSDWELWISCSAFWLALLLHDHAVIGDALKRGDS